MTDVRMGPMRWENGTELTPEEQDAVGRRVGSAIDEIFWKSEPAREILAPLIRAWWTDGERCPEDLAEIISETRELWKLAVVHADQAELDAQVAELGRLTRAGFDRRRDDSARIGARTDHGGAAD
jgi:hypothetical protein